MLNITIKQNDEVILKVKDFEKLSIRDNISIEQINQMIELLKRSLFTLNGFRNGIKYSNRFTTHQSEHQESQKTCHQDLRP